MKLDITNANLELNTIGTNVAKMKDTILDNTQEREARINSAVDEILEERLSKVRSRYDYDRQVLKQFRFKQLAKFGRRKTEIESEDNIDDKEYSANFKKLNALNELLKEKMSLYMDPLDLPLYEDIGYGIEFTPKEVLSAIEDAEYLDGLDKYNVLKEKALLLDSNVPETTLENTAIALGLILFGLYTFKLFLVVPFFLYICFAVLSRLYAHYNLLTLISMYHVTSRYVDASLDSYADNVDNEIGKISRGIDMIQTNMEQLCFKIESAIDAKMGQEIQSMKMNFDRSAVRKEAEANVEEISDMLSNRLKEEEEQYQKAFEKVDALEKELADARQLLDEIRNKIVQTYMELEPSYEAKILLKEFFLGFDSKQEPVTFKYGARETLILYDSKHQSQLAQVMKTIRMMCAQIMCSMYPLAYVIDVVDCYKAGIDLSPFQKEDTELSRGNTELFRTHTSSQDTQKHIDSMFELFQSRRVDVLSTFNHVNLYNENKIKFNARTMPYHVSFFYDFDYKFFSDNEKMRQLCRVSSNVGIVPIVFVDTNRFGISNKEKEIFYDYEPGVLLKILELFGNNIFGFSITEDSVDIIDYDVDSLKDNFRRNK